MWLVNHHCFVPLRCTYFFSRKGRHAVESLSISTVKIESKIIYDWMTEGRFTSKFEGQETRKTKCERSELQVRRTLWPLRLHPAHFKLTFRLPDTLKTELMLFGKLCLNLDGVGWQKADVDRALDRCQDAIVWSCPKSAAVLLLSTRPGLLLAERPGWSSPQK
jgi:hypothetical protein